MSNQIQSPKSQKFDLIERTQRFGEVIIGLCQKLPSNSINKVLINQLVRSSTSIGANYMEADCCDSKRDFCYKIGLCKKETKETIHWLKMLSKASNKSFDKLLKETHELTLIFSKILINTKK